jgi:hypothetical protein
VNSLRVMPGLVPGIHVFVCEKQDVDGWDKPGHDGERNGWDRCDPYRPSHFGGRFSENAFGPSM